MIFIPALSLFTLMLQTPVVFPPLNLVIDFLTSSGEGHVSSLDWSTPVICNTEVLNCPLQGSTINSRSKYHRAICPSTRKSDTRRPSLTRMIYAYRHFFPVQSADPIALLALGVFWRTMSPFVSVYDREWTYTRIACYFSHHRCYVESLTELDSLQPLPTSLGKLAKIYLPFASKFGDTMIGINMHHWYVTNFLVNMHQWKKKIRFVSIECMRQASDVCPT